ncbi:restriction endonuclease [Hahella sp. CCB-MM4]|uniref:HNH endonuclease n=1 Tax=Hahella sp. (strain CCB-MM4) TaxID=1926491 RepID=UPI000B9B28CE|nr:HNH endonuclease [Hahella sp. CCB-MM4]OZG71374.1 restriction endonuclease [Hahella sp. CCB-MM4]
MKYPLILKITSGGQPQSWLTVHQAAQHLTAGRVSWSFGETDIVLKGGFNKKGSQSSLVIPAILASRSDYARIAQSIPLTRHNLFARDRYTCMYCGDIFPERILTIDHIIPTSRGGHHTWTNTCASCMACNQRKAAQTPEEAGMALLSVPYTPNRYEYMYLRNRAILADQMDYLSKGFRNFVA